MLQENAHLIEQYEDENAWIPVIAPPQAVTWTASEIDAFFESGGITVPSPPNTRNKSHRTGRDTNTRQAFAPTATTSGQGTAQNSSRNAESISVQPYSTGTSNSCKFYSSHRSPELATSCLTPLQRRVAQRAAADAVATALPHCVPATQKGTTETENAVSSHQNVGTEWSVEEGMRCTEEPNSWMSQALKTQEKMAKKDDICEQQTGIADNTWMARMLQDSSFTSMYSQTLVATGNEGEEQVSQKQAHTRSRPPQKASIDLCTTGCSTLASPHEFSEEAAEEWMTNALETIKFLQRAKEWQAIERLCVASLKATEQGAVTLKATLLCRQAEACLKQQQYATALQHSEAALRFSQQLILT